MRVNPTMPLVAGCSFIILSALSLWPFRLRSWRPEWVVAAHLTAYALAGFCTRMVLQHTRSRLQIVVWSTAAALFEIGQIWIPARSAAFSHWMAASAGAAIGVLTAKWLLEPGTFPF